MNVSKKVEYTISLNDKEAEALFYGLGILQKMIMEQESDNVMKALEIDIDNFEDYQDTIVEIFEDLHFAQG